MRRLAMSATAAAAAVVAAVVLAATMPVLAQTGPSSPLRYRPPVDAPVTDPFRPPPEPWAAGNRGIEYATPPGTPVRAAAAGEVVFAGPVAGGLHVVVLHPDGVRTSYSFLQSIAVHRGDRVDQGRVVGTSGQRLHFGARLGEVYIDPASLFSEGPPEVFLVPDEAKRPASEEQERSGLLGVLKGLGGDLLDAGGAGMGWLRDAAAAGAHAGAAGMVRAGDTAVAAGQGAVDVLQAHYVDRLRQLRAAMHYARQIRPFVTTARMIRTAGAWWVQRQHCTPATVPAPQPGKGHLAVVVAGFGSTSGGAAVYEVNTLALGYHPADAVRFSYRGGTTAERPYDKPDTTVDIRQSARRLNALLERMAAEHPGMPIDIIAHSQGGVVARAALAYESDRSPRRPPVSALVTLGSPHQGADLATGGTVLQGTIGGQQLATAIDLVYKGAMGGPSVRGTSVFQMAEVSSFVRRLNHRPLPAGVRVTSIGAQADYIVPAGRTRLPGAHHVIVPAWGANPHDRLPRGPEAQREIALGLAGLPPTCQSLHDMLFDTTMSETIGRLEDAALAALWMAAQPTGPAPVPPADPGGG